MMRRLAALLVGLAALGGSAVSAAKPSPSTLTLVGVPVFGAQVTFEYATSMSAPLVYVNCMQAGVVVYEETHAKWLSGGTDPMVFTLGPTPRWVAGDADCHAGLYQYDDRRWPPRRPAAEVLFTAVDS